MPAPAAQNLGLTATAAVQERQPRQLRVEVDGWVVLLESTAAAPPAACVERDGDFTLVHLDLPAGPLGEYHINVQQPMLDMQRSWVGAIDCWRGSELTSLALNYSFTAMSNHQMPVLCNYARSGENRGVIGLLDHVPLTQINQRPLIEQPPMHLLQTRFTRQRPCGGFRETVLLSRQRGHFTEAIKSYMRLCRRRSAIAVAPAPDWATEPVWCSWYSHLYTLTQRDVQTQIDHLKDLGIRTVVVDASWFKDPQEAIHRAGGDYRPHTALMPDLRGLARQLHDHGLKLMLWCAPLFVGIHAEARKHLESCCILDGQTRSYRLCPSCPDARAHAAALVERLMNDFELDGLKLDFLDQPELLCADPAHPHDALNSGQAMLALLQGMHDAILRANPQAAIEYRISYSTLTTLATGNCHRGNDAPYDADYMRRQNLFLRLFCEHPAAVWNDYAYWHRDELPQNVALMLGQQIFSGGVPTLSVNLAELSAEHRQVLRQWLAFYREHRHSLAQAELFVHSADSFFSVCSLQNRACGRAYVLLSGSHIPPLLHLQPGIREAWVLNASAEPSGAMKLAMDGGPLTLAIEGRDPVHAAP